MQSDKLSEALKVYVAKAEEDEIIPVLVTTQKVVVNTAPFDASGLKVKRNMASVPVLSGTIKVSDLDQLAALPEVVKVELDSEITLDQG